jgi:hypothetical protein
MTTMHTTPPGLEEDHSFFWAEVPKSSAEQKLTSRFQSRFNFMLFSNYFCQKKMGSAVSLSKEKFEKMTKSKKGGQF